MIDFLKPSKLGTLLLCLAVLGFSACGDDDDVLGIDLDDDGTLFMSSNTLGLVGVFDTEDDPLEIVTFPAAGTDADGIWYDEDDNAVYQVDRTNGRLVSYDDVINDTEDAEIDLTSASGVIENGRGLAAREGLFIVADDATGDDDDNGNQFKVFTDISGDNIQLTSTINVDRNLWGARLVGNDLWAIQDNSDTLLYYQNFVGSVDGDTIMPTRAIKVDGIVRTHGLWYSAEDDTMILTDVGEASSDSDGALFIIPNFTSLATATTITSANYSKISGTNTMLGNPVDVTWDNDEDRIYVAERARNGGMLLVFEPVAGNTTPVVTAQFGGISSVYFHRD